MCDPGMSAISNGWVLPHYLRIISVFVSNRVIVVGSWRPWGSWGWWCGASYMNIMYDYLPDILCYAGPSPTLKINLYDNVCDGMVWWVLQGKCATSREFHIQCVKHTHNLGFVTGGDNEFQWRIIPIFTQQSHSLKRIGNGNPIGEITVLMGQIPGIIRGAIRESA